MDLSTIEGLSEDQIAAINVLNTKDIEGLVNKNKDLLTEKKTVQQTAADANLALEDSRAAANKLAEEKLIAEGKYAEALELREKENSELTAKANAEAKSAKDSLDKYHKGAALNKVLGLIHDDYKGLAEAMLSNMLKISYNDQGEVITSFENNGEVVANNVSEFRSWAEGQDSFKKILNGVDSSGAGTKQSGGSASMTNNNPEATRKAAISARLEAHGIQTKQ